MRINRLQESESNLRFLAAIVHYSDLKKGKLGLEVGCGTGILAETLGVITGAKILGTERCYEAYQLAAKRIHVRYCPDGRVPDSCVFDSIYCKDVLPMIEDRTHFFLQVRKALRPGAPFITYFGERTDLAEKPLFRFFPEGIERSLNHYVRREEMERELVSVGFSVCQFQRIYLGQVSFDRSYAGKHRDGLFNNTDIPSLDIVRAERMQELEEFANQLANYGAKATYSWERTLIVAR